MTGSLRIRLLWWLLVPLAIYVFVTGKAEYDNARRTADLVQDNTLLSSARMIAGEVEWADGMLRVDIPPAALEIFASPYGDQVFYNVSVDDDRLLAGVPDFPLSAKASASATHDSPTYYDADLHGRSIRAIGYVRRMYDNGATRRVLVSVGKTQASRDAMVRELWRPQLVRQLEMMLLAVALACIGLTFELRPLLKVKSEVMDRDPMQLEPLRVDRLHTELRPIVDAINQCIARLGVQVAVQRRFIADAAHQLRTPLTLLDTQLQYARQHRELEPSLGEALAAMQRSNRSMVGLTNKLLLLAQAEAADYTQLANQPVDLASIAKDVIEDLALFAQKRDIDLGAELEASAWMTGHEGLLSALVSNLAENAIRYTQRGGHVTVAVRGDAARVVLSVTDDGPGIPAEARSRVFEPFYRASADTEGTGLGLAIAREIVQAHRGEIALVTGEGEARGLTVKVTFVAASTDAA
ncbi:sensor histidine kinase [Paraburkholderia sabiae]|jgi:two-component system sensor histidine kinase TctE|uniref:histidine kinase n=1 Tax=Paraburkholderia sabiae TaxID=273251 RepID=A0ABU9Q3Q6_9BURK|nr:sensor histidine kinase [Paraburkholderia sabiae]WJZ71557.1 sensor histidine kinase [Paraburkholderia sabiae]CAD6520341.1 Adaptive-response sensory-kinase SasA [Paraburkholderia sabiae]